MQTANNPIPPLAEILKANPLYLEEAVDTPGASGITGVPVPSLETMRTRGGGPVFIKRGKKVTYTRRALLEWLEAGKRTSTSDPGPNAAAQPGSEGTAKATQRVADRARSSPRRGEPKDEPTTEAAP